MLIFWEEITLYYSLLLGARRRLRCKLFQWNFRDQEGCRKLIKASGDGGKFRETRAEHPSFSRRIYGSIKCCFGCRLWFSSLDYMWSGLWLEHLQILDLVKLLDQETHTEFAGGEGQQKNRLVHNIHSVSHIILKSVEKEEENWCNCIISIWNPWCSTVLI